MEEQAENSSSIENENMGSKLDIYIIITIQGVLFILFCVFGVYESHYDNEKYTMFQNVHVMIFIGFGFLMTFLKRYGFSAVGLNFLLGSVLVQWSILCLGFYKLNENYKIEIGLESLAGADVAAATVLISMGALLGRTSSTQLILMGIFEIAIFSGNLYIGTKLLQVTDAGASIFVHTFGAYFGLAVSYVINRTKTNESNNLLAESNYTSDLFAMIGTVFLWLYWPSFNAIDLEGPQEQLAIINTYLSLSACCVTTFVFSLILSEYKFDMVHIQNSTLAGGVAVGASANLLIHPYGAIIIGMLAAILSVVGYVKVTPFIERTFGIPDTCGVNNLHGMPGVFAGIIGAIVASIATESNYGASFYDIYPARASPTQLPDVGLARTASQQALYQIIALAVTLVIAIVSGLIVGLILSWKTSSPLPRKHFYDDNYEWNVPKEEVGKTPAFFIKSFPNSLEMKVTNFNSGTDFFYKFFNDEEWVSSATKKLVTK